MKDGYDDWKKQRHSEHPEWEDDICVKIKTK